MRTCTSRNAAMRAALEAGVTTVRSAGVSHFEDVGLRELVKRGSSPALSAGRRLSRAAARRRRALLVGPDLGDLLGRPDDA